MVLVLSHNMLNKSSLYFNGYTMIMNTKALALVFRFVNESPKIMVASSMPKEDRAKVLRSSFICRYKVD